MQRQIPLYIKITVLLLFVILFLYGVVIARSFLYPLCFAILFAYLLYPIAWFFEKRGVPRIISNLIAIIIGLIIASGIFFFIYKQLGVFAEDFSELRKNAINNVNRLHQFIEDKLGFTATQQRDWLSDRIENLFQSGSSLFGKAFTATTGTIFKIGIQPVYIFLFLYYRDKFRQFFLKLVPKEKKSKAKLIIDEASEVTRKYMGGIMTVVLILCVLNSVGLSIVGIKYAILLGIISALFNFIPYFGTLIGGSFPLIFALLNYENMNYAVGVLILFAIIQFTENNILTPNIVGGNVSINPFVTILSLVVGGMVWGIPGMFVVIPFIGMFKIACDHIDSLKPLSFLIGTKGTEKHALTLKKVKNIFKKRG